MKFIALGTQAHKNTETKSQDCRVLSPLLTVTTTLPKVYLPPFIFKHQPRILYSVQLSLKGEGEIVETWKQPVYPSVGKWINKAGVVQLGSGILFSTEKKGAIKS